MEEQVLVRDANKFSQVADRENGVWQMPEFCFHDSLYECGYNIQSFF